MAGFTFDSYKEIYGERGGSYHEAMSRWPDARDAEFRALADLANLPNRTSLVLDIPSGGGYLRRFLPEAIELISADPAMAFLGAGEHNGVAKAVCASHEDLPFDDATFDAVLSLAGLHHIKDQAPIFKEWYRVLKPGGILAFGDAEAGSSTSRYLDEVVDAFNTMGHRGTYLTSSIAEVLGTIGFHVESADLRCYTWDFRSRGDMLDFCRALFGMDKQPSDGDLSAEITRTVGFVETADSCHLQWALLFVRAIK